MTYTTSTTKIKAAQYDLPGIEDMVPNIWIPIKVAYAKYALLGISHWREQRKSFYAFARGMQSREDVYSTKRILAVTHVSIMRKHRHGYLEEIVVRRADNALYRFKEGDFPRLRINDIEDMLLLVKRVEDLQLRVESYQKKINVTKPDTTRPDLRNRHPYTPCKDPQGFIYVDEYKRNRLMRSGEPYKFSDGTLTMLLSSLEDITKNINMEYLLKRRWSNLEKKRAHFMIKDINKLLKERRMMRSLEKFVGGRLYETHLRLLHRYSNPMIQPEPEGSTQGYPLVSVEVLRYRIPKRRRKYNRGIMRTEMELTLEQTQQGVSYEVSNIRVISITMKMEILLEPTSNKLMVEHAEFDESDTYVLERFDTPAGNPVKKILLKLNLSDHRILKDGHGDTWL
ncbi:hypothetical protein Tco_1546014 [Tanacetum coccineum]